MRDLIIFLFACVGMTHIIIDGTIFNTLRLYLKNNTPEFFHSLFECYMCSGFWCGVILGRLVISDNFFIVFACGCASSMLSHLHANILNVLESIVIKNNP